MLPAAAQNGAHFQRNGQVWTRGGRGIWFYASRDLESAGLDPSEGPQAGLSTGARLFGINDLWRTQAKCAMRIVSRKSRRRPSKGLFVLPAKGNGGASGRCSHQRRVKEARPWHEPVTQGQAPACKARPGFGRPSRGPALVPRSPRLCKGRGPARCAQMERGSGQEDPQDPWPQHRPLFVHLQRCHVL